MLTPQDWSNLDSLVAGLNDEECEHLNWTLIVIQPHGNDSARWKLTTGYFSYVPDLLSVHSRYITLEAVRDGLKCARDKLKGRQLSDLCVMCDDESAIQRIFSGTQRLDPLQAEIVMDILAIKSDEMKFLAMNRLRICEEYEASVPYDVEVVSGV